MRELTRLLRSDETDGSGHLKREKRKECSFCSLFLDEWIMQSTNFEPQGDIVNRK
jgi:hypothetical protein